MALSASSDDRFAGYADQFLDDLNPGVDLAVALDAAREVVHLPDVVAAGRDMLATLGTIDMKRLAGLAGMSRASLYRYYPDRRQLEAEIAGLGIECMVELAASHADAADKLRVALEYLARNPGEAAAMSTLAAMVSVDTIAATVERVTGDGTHAACMLGLAVMAATPMRDADHVETLQRHIDRVVAHRV